MIYFLFLHGNICCGEIEKKNKTNPILSGAVESKYLAQCSRLQKYPEKHFYFSMRKMWVLIRNASARRF